MAEPPVIDIGPILAGPHTGPHAGPHAEATVAAIDAACREHGFFVVTGHGVPEQLIADVDRDTRAFFARPVAEKAATAAVTPVGRLGYKGLGTTVTAATLDRDTPADLVETFGIKNPHPESGFDQHNVWPAHPASFRASWSAYWDAMERLQWALMRAFERALGLEPGWFDERFDRAGTSLKANHYPAQDGADPLPGQQRRGAHTDFGFMTLLYQDDAPGGLQVEVEPDVWVDVPHLPGTFVVNVADLLSHWTGGTWASSMHRVTNPGRADAGRDRISIPFFVNPNDDAVITTMPAFATEGAAAEPITAGDWVRGKVERSTLMEMA